MVRSDVYLGQRVRLVMPGGLYDDREATVQKRPSPRTGETLVRLRDDAETELVVKLYEMEAI